MRHINTLISLSIFTVVTAITACDLPGVSQMPSSIVTSGRISPRVVSAGAVDAESAMSVSLMHVSSFSLLASDDGTELLSVMIACALRADQTVTTTTGLTFFGEIGLAHRWLRHGLDSDEQHWISACVLSRVNGEDVDVPFSARGPRRVLAATADERALFPTLEGAFYNTMAVPIACSGDADVTDRICARPSLDNPDVTMCGFAYAGKCREVCVFDESGEFVVRCYNHRQIVTAYGSQP